MTRRHSHNVIEPFQRRDRPSIGYCLAWTVKDGKAEQCGASCKGQLCDEHTHTTRPVMDSLRRRSLV